MGIRRMMLGVEQLQKAEAAGISAATDKAKQFDIIVAAISCDGTLNPTLRDKLAEEIGEPDLLKMAKTPEELKTLLRGAPGYVEDLFKAASKLP